MIKEQLNGQFGILELLSLRGFDSKCKAKLVRHQDYRFDMNELIASGWIECYQSHQAKDIFGKCEYIVSFAGDGSKRARFLGVYRVMSGRKRTQDDLPFNSPFEAWRNEENYADGFFYELEKQTQFNELEGRVVVGWTGKEINWHQNSTNMPVIEIYPPGRSLVPFADYLDFSLSFKELKQLVANPAAHRDWKTSLSAVAGVYLILAETTGNMYVGSASGTEGFWGRWSNYANNGHGGNSLLKKLVETDAQYPESFRFSLLQVLPKTNKRKEVVRWETQYKKKLGSRATGLNASEVSSLGNLPSADSVSP